MKTYRAWNPSQSFLLPPSPLEWLPEGHLAYFVLEVVETIDLAPITSAIQAKDPRGERPYPPALMVALLLYGYATGVFSSRKIAQATYGDVAFRVIAGGTHPHFTTINEFRTQFWPECAELFLHVLRLCRAAGMVSLGHLAIDGSKLAANASKHKAMSYERMRLEEARLREEIEGLRRKAEEADRQDDARFGEGRDAEDLPEELRLRTARLERIQQAKAALEREAAAARAEQLRENAAGQRAKVADEQLDAIERRRAASRAAKAECEARKLSDDDDDEPGAGQLEDDVPKHRVPAHVDGTPKPKAQRNFTDPDSRIMMREGTALQAYNAQVAVDEQSQVIVAELLTNQPPDVEHFAPVLERAIANCDGNAPDVVTADNGYLSKASIDACERHGVDGHIACGREAKGIVNPPGTGSEGAALQARALMAAKLGTEAGRSLYARRKTIVEPAFGQIKGARGFRRFSVRGLPKVRGEWTLVCATHNLLKLFRSIGSLETLAARLAV